jgi:hypothetical protein
MTRHLAPHEFVDATDGRLAAAREAHLQACARCREELTWMEAVLRSLEPAGAVPMPSPVFWQKFSRRVRLATSAPPARSFVWRHFWRPALALGSVTAAAVFLVVTSRPVALPDVQPAALSSNQPLLEARPTPAGLLAEVASGQPDAPEPRWDSVVQVASGLPWEDVRRSAVTRPGTVDLAISDLSSAERLELAKLLQAEIGGRQ